MEYSKSQKIYDGFLLGLRRWVHEKMTKRFGGANWSSSVANIFDATIVQRMEIVATIYPLLGPAAGLELKQLLQLADQKAFLILNQSVVDAVVAVDGCIEKLSLHQLTDALYPIAKAMGNSDLLDELASHNPNLNVSLAPLPAKIATNPATPGNPKQKPQKPSSSQPPAATPKMTPKKAPPKASPKASPKAPPKTAPQAQPSATSSSSSFAFTSHSYKDTKPKQPAPIAKPTTARYNGSVTKVLAESGFGFIQPKLGGPVHMFFLDDVHGGSMLHEGDKVSYESAKGKDPKKPKAKSVALLGLECREINVQSYLKDLLSRDVRTMILHILADKDVWRFCLRRQDDEFSSALCLLLLQVLSRDGLTDTMLTKPLFEAYEVLVGSDFLQHRGALPGAVQTSTPAESEGREIVSRTFLFAENFISILDYKHTDQLPLDELRRVLARPDAYLFPKGLPERFAEMTSAIEAQWRPPKPPNIPTVELTPVRHLSRHIKRWTGHA